MGNTLTFMGSFMSYVTHLGGGRGYPFVLRNVTEEERVLAKMLCDAKNRYIEFSIALIL